MSGPIKTTVQGILYDPTGNLVTGKLIISNDATFTSADGFLIMQGFSVFYDVLAGAVDIDLIPYSQYSVKVEVTEGFFFQVWSVPQPGSPPTPVTLVSVIV